MAELRFAWSNGATEVRILQDGPELVEEWYATDLEDERYLILVSVNHPALVRSNGGRVSDLYQAALSLPLTELEVVDDFHVRLTGETEAMAIQKDLVFEERGFTAELLVTPLQGPLEVRSLLLTYAFSPGTPDTTYLPGLRPGPEYVVGDHQFRAPVAVAQRGQLAAMLFPDLDILAENRPIETVLDLDCRNGVVDVPLLSFGFAAHKAVPHVYFVADLDSTRPVSGPLRLKARVRIEGIAKSKAAYYDAARLLWPTAASFFEDPKPQALPFEEYARYCYPAAFSEVYEGTQRGWFEREIDGHVCGGVPSGWGMGEGYVSWQCWFNNLRSAYGMRSWGRRLGDPDLIDKSEKMLNLALAAPMDRGACPTTYEGDLGTWRGCLVRPTGEEYYDLANMAWKGIWLLRWARDFDDCPRRDEILHQCREMAACMMRHQDRGAFPSWLTVDHDPLPLLDRAAQSALPGWFLLELNRTERSLELAKAGLETAQFLMQEVIEGGYYYDFETFFSCSAKPCRQSGGQVDHQAMRDPHSLQPPQNTLSMQWCVELLKSIREPYGIANAYKVASMMSLYQNVWPIPYRETAYTFGGFGVQNSDGEYLDARQAQFAETLCDLGVRGGSQELFERGVAAARASIALVNHPLHEELGIYPNPNFGPGLMPENCCHDGFEQQNIRTGFDWGEGSALTTMAILLDKYGTSYTHRLGKWTVAVDACA